MSICISNETAADKLQNAKEMVEYIQYWASRTLSDELEMYLTVAVDALQDAIEFLDV